MSNRLRHSVANGNTLPFPNPDQLGDVTLGNDHRHRCLLRPRHERQCCRATEQRESFEGLFLYYPGAPAGPGRAARPHRHDAHGPWLGPSRAFTQEPLRGGMRASKSREVEPLARAVSPAPRRALQQSRRDKCAVRPWPEAPWPGSGIRWRKVVHQWNDGGLPGSYRAGGKAGRLGLHTNDPFEMGI